MVLTAPRGGIYEYYGLPVKETKKSYKTLDFFESMNKSLDDFLKMTPSSRKSGPHSTITLGVIGTNRDNISFELNVQESMIGATRGVESSYIAYVNVEMEYLEGTNQDDLQRVREAITSQGFKRLLF